MCVWERGREGEGSGERVEGGERERERRREEERIEPKSGRMLMKRRPLQEMKTNRRPKAEE